MKKNALKPINKKRGLYQIVHDFEFVALNLGLGYTEIRDMNYEEKYEYMCARLKKLSDRGYGGVVLNSDFKNYLEIGEDIDLIARVSEYAKSLGLGVWIYDEQYYPSGTAGGLTLKEHPELETLGLAEVVKTRSTNGKTPIRVASPYGHSELKYAIAIPVTDGECDYSRAIVISDKKDLSGGLSAYLPEGEWCVRCYFYRAIYDHSPYAQALRASRRTMNVFDSRTVDRFFEVTYENGYLKHFRGKLGDTVDAIFTDEPHYPACMPHTEPLKSKTKLVSHSVFEEEDFAVTVYPYIPWTTDLPDRYFKAYGEDIVLNLPHLFTKTEKAREIRVKFYTLLSEMAREGFVVNYQSRLANEGVKLSGHYYYEESPDFHPIYFGDIIDHLSSFSIPGCDMLYTSADMLRYCIACKTASSASHLSGKELTMIEASNMFDKDMTISLEKMKGAISIMFANGVNLITSYYGEDILPPEEMAEFADYVSKLSSISEGGAYKTDTLVYYPFEQACAASEPIDAVNLHTKFHDDMCVSECIKTLIGAQVCFDLVNKRFLLEAELSDGVIILRNGQKIKRILLPRIDWIDGAVAKFLNEARLRGVEILSFDGNAIEGLDFTPLKAETNGFKGNEVVLSEADPCIIVSERQFADYDLFMLVNSAEEHKHHTVSILDSGNEYAIVDIKNYALTPVAVTKKDGHAQLEFDFDSLEARLVIRYK